MANNNRVYRLRNKKPKLEYTDTQTVTETTETGNQTVTEEPKIPTQTPVTESEHQTETTPTTTPETTPASAEIVVNTINEPTVEETTQPVIEAYSGSENTQPNNDETTNPENDETKLTTDEYNVVIENIPQPDAWVITIPTDPELPHLLNLIKNNNITNVIPLTEENSESLYKLIKSYYNPKDEPKIVWYKAILNSWKRHKILGTLAIIIGIFVLANLVTSIALNGIF